MGSSPITRSRIIKDGLIEAVLFVICYSIKMDSSSNIYNLTIPSINQCIFTVYGSMIFRLEDFSLIGSLAMP